MRSFQATAIQMHSGPDKAANLAEARRLVEEAAESGSSLVVLPELFFWRGGQDREGDAAEPVPGPTSEAMGCLARDLSIYLVAGSILRISDEAADQDRARPKYRNTCLLFGPDGSQLASYDKIHLFDIDLPGRISLRESDSRSPGGQTVCVETELGLIGLAVCYDLRCPELFRRLSDAGAELIVMPSAFTAATGQAHWHALLRARAIENQCYLLAPNQYGKALQGFEDYGHSLIVDPWGKVLAESGSGGAATVSAWLDASHLQRIRRELPCLTHRKIRC